MLCVFFADDCNIWDEASDQEGNIRFDKKRPGVVVGATFNKLVERITSLTDHGEKEWPRQTWKEGKGGRGFYRVLEWPFRVSLIFLHVCPHQTLNL